MHAGDTTQLIHPSPRPANEVTVDTIENELTRLHELVDLIERRAEAALLEANGVTITDDLNEIQRAARLALSRISGLRWCP
jgi:hypothetical protein